MKTLTDEEVMSWGKLHGPKHAETARRFLAARKLAEKTGNTARLKLINDMLDTVISVK